jgi:hypothetical protein
MRSAIAWRALATGRYERFALAGTAASRASTAVRASARVSLKRLEHRLGERLEVTRRVLLPGEIQGDVVGDPRGECLPMELAGVQSEALGAGARHFAKLVGHSYVELPACHDGHATPGLVVSRASWFGSAARIRGMYSAWCYTEAEGTQTD